MEKKKSFGDGWHICNRDRERSRQWWTLIRVMCTLVTHAEKMQMQRAAGALISKMNSCSDFLQMGGWGAGAGRGCPGGGEVKKGKVI